MLIIIISVLINLSVEDEGGGAGHIDMIVCLVPLDVECAAVHHDVALSARSACQTGGHSGGAGSSATGLGDATAPLPDAGADFGAAAPLPCRGKAAGRRVSGNGVRGGVSDLGKLDVATLREGGVMLKGAACLADLVDVVGEDDVVGITHGDEKGRPTPLPLPVREGSR